MAVFTNLNSTVTSLDPGFDFTAFSDQIAAAQVSLDSAVTTIATTDPVSFEADADSAEGVWADGTQLKLDLSAVRATSFTVDELELKAPDDAELELEGRMTVTANAAGAILISNVQLEEVEIGNEVAKLDIDGSLRLNADTGTLSGTVTSLELEFLDDDPATPETEFRFVELKGRVGITGDLFGNLTLSGAFTNVEVGVETENADDSVTRSVDSSAARVKIGAATLFSDLDDDGFAALTSSLFAGHDKIDGTAGDDVLNAATGNDQVFGEEGNDAIDGGAGNDRLSGGAGDDNIIGGTGNDKIFGDDGSDVLDGGAGNDQLFGGTGNDFIDGGTGNDRIVDESGNNVVTDTAGKAMVTTGAGDDDILTGAGNDRIVAGDGANLVDAGDGNDNITTGAGNDLILAGGGNDKVTAGEGINEVDGGAGNDVLRAGAGNDVLIGGAGNDKLFGGSGSDVFVFDNLAGGKDVIGDFSTVDDFLAFDLSVFTALAGGIAADNLVLGKTAADTNDFLIFDTQGGKLYYDADGSNAGAAVQIAVVKGSLTGLDAGNFIDEATLFA